MKFHKSYRFSIFLSFCVFGFMLSCSYAIFIYISSQYVEKDMQKKRFGEEIKFFTEKYYRDGKGIRYFLFSSLYIGREELPMDTRIKTEKLSDGIYFSSDMGGRYSIAIKTLKDGKVLYILHDDKALDKLLNRKRRLIDILIYGFIASVFLSLIVGLYTSSKLINPIKKLYGMVIKTDPENLQLDLSDEFKEDEVGVLAVALEDSMKRINSFIGREKQFTRDASHELRTPVTIIKGAVELLQNIPDEKKEKREDTLKRIERSVKDMETTIETFLWLGRESNVEENLSLCNVKNVVESCIDDNRYLLHGKDVKVSVVSDGNPDINTLEPVFKIAVTNLIRNAFNYTNTGSVSIKVKEDYIEVSDTGSGINKDDLEHVTKAHIKGAGSKGFGLGLSIVKQLCLRFSWKLEIESSVESGTIARLVF
ncbi:MAG: HAMP domain-containing histidine kinase [Deltaproteobacteria bacterium]|nr:HAMP domain-containing histidine kinase [Deltaproteobacteria bacterium]